MIKTAIIGILLILLSLSVGANAVMAQGMPQPFQSEAELETWLEPYGVHRGQDCDDAALELFADAWMDGYLLWPAPVYNGKLMGETVLTTAIRVKRHFGLWTWIGNDIYYVDLQLKAPHYVKLKHTWLD